MTIGRYFSSIRQKHIASGQSDRTDVRTFPVEECALMTTARR